MICCAQLRRHFPNLRQIAGHEDLDTALMPASDDPSLQVRRKLDPGACSPGTRCMEGSDLTRIRSEAQRRGVVTEAGKQCSRPL